MEEIASVYAGELKQRGFDEWECDDLSRKLAGSIPANTLPVFLPFGFEDQEYTLVIDERAIVWAAQGTIFLTDLGFRQILFDATEPSRILS